jgi:hypothetical protein
MPTSAVRTDQGHPRPGEPDRCQPRRDEPTEADLSEADLTKARLREAKPTKAYERPGHRLSDHDVPIDEDDPTADRDVGQGGQNARLRRSGRAGPASSQYPHRTPRARPAQGDALLRETWPAGRPTATGAAAVSTTRGWQPQRRGLACRRSATCRLARRGRGERHEDTADRFAAGLGGWATHTGPPPRWAVATAAAYTASSCPRTVGPVGAVAAWPAGRGGSRGATAQRLLSTCPSLYVRTPYGERDLRPFRQRARRRPRPADIDKSSQPRCHGRTSHGTGNVSPGVESRMAPFVGGQTATNAWRRS